VAHSEKKKKIGKKALFASRGVGKIAGRSVCWKESLQAGLLVSIVLDLQSGKRVVADFYGFLRLLARF
jgi:hypothetical protein